MAKKKEKDFDYTVKLEFAGSMPATTRSKAIEAIKESFVDEYNIDLSDDEITID